MIDELMQLGDRGPTPKVMIVAASVFAKMKLEGLTGVARDEAELELCKEFAEYGNPDLIQIDFKAGTWEPVEVEG